LGLVEPVRTHHDSPGESGDMKHIVHLLNTVNLLANQKKFTNGIVPEATAPLK
jgi:hypothetical protein